MKYVGKKMSLEASMLSESLQTWLGHELEIRGIDAVIYTRYILSILQQDSFDADVEGGEGDIFHQTRHDLMGRGRARKIAEKWKLSSGGYIHVDSEEMKKSAAVQCLLSVSDEDSGIKNLVDELYLKLKEQESVKACNPVATTSSTHDQSTGSDDDGTTEDPAERYYAAFPPLSEKCDTTCLPQVPKSEGHLWAQVAQKSLSRVDRQNDDSGIEDKSFCDFTDHEGDIMNEDEREFPENPRSMDVKSEQGKHRIKETSNSSQDGPREEKREPLKPTHMISKAQIHLKYQDKPGKEKSHARVIREARANIKEEKPHGGKYLKQVHFMGKSDGVLGKNKLAKVKSGENKENKGDERRVSPQRVYVSHRWTDIELPQPTFIVPKVKPSPKLYKDNLQDVSPSVENIYQKKPLSKAFESSVQPVRNQTFQEQKEHAEKMRDKCVCVREDKEPPHVSLGYMDELEVQNIFGESTKINSSEPGENWMWYTEPLEALVPPSPVPSQRLYKRHSPTEDVMDFDFSHLFNLSDLALDDGEQPLCVCGGTGHLGDSSSMSALSSVQLDCKCERNTEESSHVKVVGCARGVIEETLDSIAAADYCMSQSEEMCTCMSDSDDDGTTYLREINLFMDNSCSGSNSSQGSRVFTPESTENQVLDDRPVFELGPNLAEVFAQAALDIDNVAEKNSAKDLDRDGLVCSLFARTEPAPVSELYSAPDDEDDTNIVSQLLLSIQTDMFSSSWPESSDEDTLTASFSTTAWQSDTSEMERSFDSLCGRIHSLCLKELGDSGSSDVLQSPELQILTCDSCVSNNNINSDLYLGAGSCAWTFFSGMPKTSIWSSYLDCESPAFMENHGLSWQQLNATNATFDDDRPWEFFSSPLTLHLSPKGCGTQTSHLWDVNVQKKVTFLTPDGGERSTTENIHKYLWNLRFGFSGDNGFSQGQEFIRGGLYGNSFLGLQDSIWDQTIPGSPRKSTLSCDTVDDVFSDPDDPEHLWDNFSCHPLFSKQRSTSADHVDDETVAGLRFARSVEILPSANSAFKDIIPTRLPHLPHVQSEPILSLEHLFHHDCQGRMVQVKHLYKSESSILKQLGLASGGEELDKSDIQHVQYSPETHFRPIKSPQKGSKDGTPTGSSEGSLVQQALYNIFSINIPTPDAQSSNQMYGRNSGYQVYHGLESRTEDVKTFVPRFLIKQGYEKYIQTGAEEAPEAVEVSENDEVHVELSLEPCSPPSPVVEEAIEAQTDIERDSPSEHTLEMLLSDVKDMLQLDKDEATKFVLEDMNNYDFFTESPTSGQENSSDYESMNHDVSTDDLSTSNLAELWNEDDSSCGATPVQAVPCSSMYKSIWSCGTEHDIPSVPGSYNAGTDLRFESLGPPLQGQDHWHFTGTDSSWTTEPTVNMVKGDQKAEDLERVWAASPDDDVFSDDDSPDAILITGQVTHSQVMYSTELEEEWLNSGSLFEIQVPKMKTREKRSVQRKPCSFFLEGNCRRTDCKFAHDMSTITCRFWEEKECFKGITCPFLHGYPSDSPNTGRKSSDSSDFQLDSGAFRELFNSNSQDENSSGSTECLKSSGSLKRMRKSERDKNRASYIATRKQSNKEKKKSKSLTTDSKSKSK